MNLAHIVAAVEFTVAEMAVNLEDKSVAFGAEIEDKRAVRDTAREAVGKTAA